MSHVTILLSPCHMSPSLMSHVELKKWPCPPVDFRGQGPFYNPADTSHDAYCASSSVRRSLHAHSPSLTFFASISTAISTLQPIHIKGGKETSFALDSVTAESSGCRLSARPNGISGLLFTNFVLPAAPQCSLCIETLSTWFRANGLTSTSNRGHSQSHGLHSGSGSPEEENGKEGGTDKELCNQRGKIGQTDVWQIPEGSGI